MTKDEELEDLRNANKTLYEVLNLRETNIKLLLQINDLLREQCKVLKSKVAACEQRAEAAEKSVAMLELELGVPVQ